MGKTEYQEITRTYLAYLKKCGLVESEAIAVLIEDSDIKNPSPHGPIEVVIISKNFGKDLISEGQSLFAATWDIDPRIRPFAASFAEWHNSRNYFMLALARKNGCVIE